MRNMFWVVCLLLCCLRMPAVAEERPFDEALINATRTVVAAIASQTQSQPKVSGDKLAELYVRSAAEAATALPLPRQRQAFLLGLAIACDDSGKLAAIESEKQRIAAIESAAARENRVEKLGAPTLYQRRELWTNFLVGCYLAARSDIHKADAVRRIRDWLDVPSGDDFSMTELTAGLSGIAFARAIQERQLALSDVESQFAVRDYVVNPVSITQGAAEQELVKPGQLEAAIQQIEKRLERLPAYWKSGDAGPLQPEEVAIIAVRDSLKSQEVAAYYARARGIPLSHICWIETAPGKNISREQWEEKTRPAIRNWLVERQLTHQIRCLVTVWDVPLKIGKRARNLARHKAFLQADRRQRVRHCREAILALQAIAASDPQTQGEGEMAVATVKDLGQVFQREQLAAVQRIKSLPTEERGEAQRRYTKSINKFGGLRAVLAAAQQQKQAGDKAAQLEKQVAFLQGRLLGLQEGANTVGRLPDIVERDEQLLAIVALAAGALGTVEWVDSQLALLEKNETYSSFDSELSLLFWLDYPLMRWQANPLHYRYDNSPLRERQHTLMVSRLEAPTLEITKRLIDDALAAEKSGLPGTLFLDARGLKGNPGKNPPGSYASYDQSLRDLKVVMDECSKNRVVLDDRAALFQPGDCPDTSLYCGWYSLANYIDAFEFQRGAVGYHMASSEAVTLRDVRSQVWCKRMLEDGICATLGPVHEPYLSAFPPPEDFFVTFASGRYSLVETYYRTKPFGSWVMVLVGDPLYNPFRSTPGIDVDKLPEKYQRILGLTKTQ